MVQDGVYSSMAKSRMLALWDMVPARNLYRMTWKGTAPVMNKALVLSSLPKLPRLVSQNKRLNHPMMMTIAVRTKVRKGVAAVKKVNLSSVPDF